MSENLKSGRFEAGPSGALKDKLMPLFKEAALEISQIVQAGNASALDASKEVIKKLVRKNKISLSDFKREWLNASKLDIDEHLPQNEDIKWNDLFRLVFGELEKEFPAEKSDTKNPSEQKKKSPWSRLNDSNPL